MKRFLFLATAVTLISGMAWAQDGAALYKAKCASCHGAMGEGKIGPSLQKTALTQEQIATVLENGAAGKKAPHAKGIAGVTADQASAIAAYVATLKK